MGYNVIFEKYPKDEMRTIRNFQTNRKMNIPENMETMLTHFWKFAITLGGKIVPSMEFVGIPKVVRSSQLLEK